MNSPRLPQFYVILLGVFSLVVTSSLYSQSALNEESDTILYQKLKEGLSGDLVALRPVIEELLKRSAEVPGQQESLIFLLALSYQDEYSKTKSEATLQSAAQQYEDYVELFPTGTRRDFVRFNLGGVYNDLEQYDKAIENYDWLYRRSKNNTLRNAARDKMSRIYISSNRAAEGIPIFYETFNVSVLNPELRAQAASWLIQGYLASGKAEAITPYLRYLTGRYEAVFDPKFNITLLKTGDAMFEQKNYDHAILLYTFVKSRDSIIEFYRDLVSSLKNKVRYLSTESDNYAVIDGQLKSAEANLKAVREIRSYDVDMKWRIARVFKETERHWEALWAFYHLYQDYQDHEQVEDFLFIAFKQADILVDVHMLEMLANEYLGNEKYAKYQDEVTLGLAAFYSKQKRYKELVTLSKDYLKEPRSFVVAAQLMNYIGNYYVQETKFAELNAYVSPLVSRFKAREPLYETTRYWNGLSQILLADYASAAETMSAFIADYTEKSSYYEDVYYRYAICLYGLQDKQKAEAQFTSFVEKYPSSLLRGEAELYLGDLKRERRAYAESAEHYRNVENYTENPAFIAKSIFALAEVLDESGKSDEAIEILADYIERHSETGQLADAHYRMGMIHDKEGRYAKRFEIHAEAIRTLGNDLNRYAVDQLITDYIKDYSKYEKTFDASNMLLDRLIADDAFRNTFLKDRSYQYQYMQSGEGVFLDRSLAKKLIRNRNFRTRILETEIKTDPATGQEIAPKGPVVTKEMVLDELSKLKEVFVSKSNRLSPHTPGGIFPALLKQAKTDELKVLEMRSEMALDALKDASQKSKIIYSYEELAAAPPAVINWAASKREESQPEEAIKLYSYSLQIHPHSPAAYDAVLAMAELSMRMAEKNSTKENWQTALGYYELLTGRFGMKIKDAEPHLKKGQILSQLGMDQKAIDVLGMILRNPSWKGLGHAEAHLHLGLAYRRNGQLSEAHGFFERLIVAYGGYAETVSWAYYYDMLTLKEMGEAESVQQLLAEYRTRLAILEKTEAHKLIDETFTL
ncbi:MAG: tetratricopeptide repeat protein [Verrucomicrobiota bacterium]